LKCRSGIPSQEQNDVAARPSIYEEKHLAEKKVNLPEIPSISDASDISGVSVTQPFLAAFLRLKTYI